MPSLTFNRFGGIRPKIDPRRLPNHEAQTAENVDLRSGTLVPFKDTLQEYVLPDSNRLTIYKWRRGSGSEWLSWTTDVDIVKAPVADDEKYRIFYLENGGLRVKGWDAGAASDRSCVLLANGKPTCTTSKMYSYFSSLRVIPRHNVWASVPFNMVFDEDLVKFSVTYHVSDNPTEFDVRFVYPQGGSLYGGVQYIDIGNYPEATQTYEFKEDTNSETYASPQVIGAVFGKNQRYGAVNLIADMEVTVKMNYTRQTTQYQYYCTTWVDDWGMESPPSEISAQVTWLPGEKVTVHSLGATNSVMFPHASKVRLYRSAAGSSEDAFYFVAELTTAVQSYVDVKTDSELAEPLPLLTAPPTGLQGLIVMPGGFVVAFKTRELYMSPPYIPYSMPTDYQLTFDHDIVAIAASGNDIIVMTKGYPYYVTGSHPEVMTQTKLMIEQSCVAKKGVCNLGDMVFYPSPDGMVAVQGGQARLITEPFYTREQWNALTPSSMIANVHDNMMFMCMTGGTLVFDPKNGLLVTTTKTWTALHEDLEDDLLYLVVGSNIVAWGQGSSYLTMKWKSKEFQLKRPFEWNSGRVFSDTYTGCILRGYAEKTLVTTINVIDKKAFRCPVRRPERVWEIEIENDDQVIEMSVSTAMEALR